MSSSVNDSLPQQQRPQTEVDNTNCCHCNSFSSCRRICYSGCCVDTRVVGPRCWHIADSVLCLFVFFPAMLCYWRGIWDLIGYYIEAPDEGDGQTPDHHLQPFSSTPSPEPAAVSVWHYWTVAAIGSSTIIAYFLHPVVRNRLVLADRNYGAAVFIAVVVTKIYLYAVGVISMAYWRGVWVLADHYLGPFGWPAAMVGLAVSYGLLLGFGVARTVVFPPFNVALDTGSNFLVPSTKFRSQVFVLL